MKLSYSRLKDFKTCPRKFYHAHVERIKKIEEDAGKHHAAWGIAFHEALASYYEGKGMEEAKKAFRENYPLHLDEGDLAKTPETGIKCLIEYDKFYRDLDKNWKVISCEEADVIEVNGVIWEVHVDMVADNLQGSGLFLWDHKTVGRVPSFSYWLRYDMSDQLTAYTYWARKKYKQCSGFLINNVTVGHRKRAYRGEPAGFWCKFERQMFNRNDRQIEAWKDDVKKWHERVLWSFDNKSWPKNPGELCAWCSYRELCLSENDEQVKECIYEKKGDDER